MKEPSDSPNQIAAADTCFFLRFLTGEPIAQARKAKAAIERAKSGQLELRVPAIAIAELIWTLESSIYCLPKYEAAEKAIAVLNTKGIQVEESTRLEEAAILHAERNIDFTDAYLACFARDETDSDLFTFDKDFKKLEWISILN